MREETIDPARKLTELAVLAILILHRHFYISFARRWNSHPSLGTVKILGAYLKCPEEAISEAEMITAAAMAQAIVSRPDGKSVRVEDLTELFATAITASTMRKFEDSVPEQVSEAVGEIVAEFLAAKLGSQSTMSLAHSFMEGYQSALAPFAGSYLRMFGQGSFAIDIPSSKVDLHVALHVLKLSKRAGQEFLFRVRELVMKGAAQEIAAVSRDHALNSAQALGQLGSSVCASILKEAESSVIPS